jgi:hypothetical protein
VFLVTTLLASLVAARRGHRLYLFSWVWFFMPLIPVSQWVAPLQNRMADRYAWLSVMAPCLLFSAFLAWLAVRNGLWRVLSRPLAALTALTLATLSFQRAMLFADSVLLFTDATLKSSADPRPVYYLARSLADVGREPEAVLAYREALRRSEGSGLTVGRSAANGLASLLAKHGDLGGAEQVLRHARTAFPGDPRLARNLAKLLRASNRPGEAEQVEHEASQGSKQSSGPDREDP